MTSRIKRTTLFLLAFVAIATVMIAASLPPLKLQPGMPLPRLQEGQVVAAPAEETQTVSVSVNTFIVAVFALILAGATLYSMVQLLRGINWRTILDSLRSMLVISAVISGLIFLIMLLPVSSGNAPIEMPIPTPEPVVTSPLGSVPPVLLWLAGIGLLVISVLVAVWIFTSSRQAGTLDRVSLEAEKAWQALRTGTDLKDVIVKCYLQMSLALKNERSIERKDFMTTGEFEHLLEAAGIPHEPIHQLTRLFDAVRYGHWQPNAADEQEAIRCLEAIMIYSRQIKETH